MKIIEVYSCAECPYRTVDNECTRTMNEIDNIHSIPVFCPLEDEEE